MGKGREREGEQFALIIHRLLGLLSPVVVIIRIDINALPLIILLAPLSDIS